jgi:transposase
MKPYSKDLRTRVLDTVDGGMPREEVAQVFSVSVPTIKRFISTGAAREGQIVLLDNLGAAHKTELVRGLIEAQRCNSYHPTLTISTP